MRTYGLSAQEVSDTQLGEVFNLLDMDGGGTLSAEEFVVSLRKNETAGHTMSPQAFEKSMFELADYWSKGIEEAELYISFRHYSVPYRSHYRECKAIHSLS